MLPTVPKPDRILLATIVALSLSLGIALPDLAHAQSSVEVLQEFDMEQVRVTDPYYVNTYTKTPSLNYITMNLVSFW